MDRFIHVFNAETDEPVLINIDYIITIEKAGNNRTSIAVNYNDGVKNYLTNNTWQQMMIKMSEAEKHD